MSFLKLDNYHLDHKIKKTHIILTISIAIVTIGIAVLIWFFFATRTETTTLKFNTYDEFIQTSKNKLLNKEESKPSNKKYNFSGNNPMDKKYITDIVNVTSNDNYHEIIEYGIGGIAEKYLAHCNNATIMYESSYGKVDISYEMNKKKSVKFNMKISHMYKSSVTGISEETIITFHSNNTFLPISYFGIEINEKDMTEEKGIIRFGSYKSNIYVGVKDENNYFQNFDIKNIVNIADGSFIGVTTLQCIYLPSITIYNEYSFVETTEILNIFFPNFVSIPSSYAIFS